MMFGPRHQWKWRIPLTNKWQSRFWAFELLLPVAPLGLSKVGVQCALYKSRELEERRNRRFDDCRSLKIR